MGQSYSGFEALMLQNVSSLPDIRISAKSGLINLFNELVGKVSLRLESDATDKEIVSETMSIIESMLNDPDYANLTADIQRAANALSKEVSQAFYTLRGPLHDQVSSISAEVRSRTDNNLRIQGAESLIAEDATPSVDFAIVNWGNLKNMAYATSILDTVNAMTGLKGYDIERGDLQYARKAMQKQEGFQIIELNKEIKDELIQLINKVVNSREIDELADTFEIFLSPSRFTGYCNNMHRYSGVTDDLAGACAWVLNRVELVRSVTKAINTIPLNLSDQTKESLFSNLKKIEAVATLGEYFLLYCRERMFKDKLILNSNMINNEELVKFRNQGGTVEDIAYYLRVFHKQAPVPFDGVATERILGRRQDVKEQIKQADGKLQMRKKIIMGKAVYGAYVDTLTSYLQNLGEEVLPEGVSAKDFFKENFFRVKYTAERLHGSDDNIEDALYTFLLDTWYDKTLVKTLFSYMGREYAKMIQQYDNLDEGDMIKLTDNLIVSSLVSEYLMRMHCEPA